MAVEAVEISDRLRDLLRAGRKRARMTQAQAAQAAGISVSWWSQIETGVYERATLDTLAEMFYAVDVPPRALRRVGYDDLSEAVEQRIDWFAGEATSEWRHEGNDDPPAETVVPERVKVEEAAEEGAT